MSDNWPIEIGNLSGVQAQKLVFDSYMEKANKCLGVIFVQRKFFFPKYVSYLIADSFLQLCLA